MLSAYLKIQIVVILLKVYLVQKLINCLHSLVWIIIILHSDDVKQLILHVSYLLVLYFLISYLLEVTINNKCDFYNYYKINKNEFGKISNYIFFPNNFLYRTSCTGSTLRIRRCDVSRQEIPEVIMRISKYVLHYQCNYLTIFAWLFHKISWLI